MVFRVGFVFVYAVVAYLAAGPMAVCEPGEASGALLVYPPDIIVSRSASFQQPGPQSSSATQCLCYSTTCNS